MEFPKDSSRAKVTSGRRATLEEAVKYSEKIVAEYQHPCQARVLVFEGGEAKRIVSLTDRKDGKPAKWKDGVCSCG